MLRVALQCGDQRQQFPFVPIRSRQEFRQTWLAVCQRARLVEDGRATCVDRLQHGGVANDDAPPGSERHGTNDGHGDGDQQRARGGDHEDGQESSRVKAYRPGGQRDGYGHGRVDGSELVSQPPQSRTALFRGSHHLHDLGVPGVHGQPIGPDGQRRIAVDCPRQNGRPGCLGHLVRLAGEIRLVHHAVSLDYGAVHRADLVREHHQRVAKRHRIQLDVGHLPVPHAVRGRGHALRQRLPAPRKRCGPRRPPTLRPRRA